MTLLDLLQELTLGWMFVASLATGAAFCALILGIVRLGLRLSGHDPSVPLQIRDVMIGAISAVFALMIAFSAAGIWNDAVQANAAVQREANALENVLAVSTSLPADLSEKVRESVIQYGRQVVETDWPAMQHRVPVSDPVYDTSDDILIRLLDLLSRDHARIGALPTFNSLIAQIVDARSARLARITLANGGVSGPQWLAMLLVSLAALATIAVCHTHAPVMQVVAMSLYTLAASVAFFVILAHDRPFVGIISVSSAPIVHLTMPAH